jgi:predicted dehydrogenase
MPTSLVHRHPTICDGGVQRNRVRFKNSLSGHWWSGNEEQGFTVEFRVFAQSILNGRWTEREDAGEAAGAEDGVEALELLEAVRESGARHHSVSLPVADRSVRSAMR